LKYFLNVSGTPENTKRKSKKIKDFARNKHISVGTSSVDDRKFFIDVWREKDNTEFVKFLNKLKERLPNSEYAGAVDINWSTRNYY